MRRFWRQFLQMWKMWKSFLVPRIVKSRSQCPKNTLFVENVTILPGTDNTVETL